MQSRRALPLLLVLLPLAACQPRAPLATAPVPEPPPLPLAEEAPIERLERARLLYDEGVMLARRSLWREAAERHRLAAELDPGGQRYWLALADALAALGRDGEAADALLAAIRLEEGSASPNHRVLVVDYERLVRYLTRAHRLDEARQSRERQETHRRLRDAPP
jgi:tetratricopeptide (TPR) repeat protein